MSFSVAKSETPLVFDTLPVLKVRRYTGEMRPGRVYTYARMYLQGGSLVVGLYAFEQTPPPGSRVGLALSAPGGDTLFLALGPQSCAVQLLPGFTTPLAVKGPGQAVPARHFAGSDEQGWFWGASATLSPALLARAGITAASGRLLAAVYKYNQGEAALGCSAETLQEYPIQAL